MLRSFLNSYLLTLTFLPPSPPGFLPAVDVCFEDAGVEADGGDVVVGAAGWYETTLAGGEGDGLGQGSFLAHYLYGLAVVAEHYLALAADAHRDDEGVVFLQVAMEAALLS